MFDRHRQPWQCSIICCQLAVVVKYYDELQTQSQSPRHSPGLGGGGGSGHK